jgi:hypothetical protein
VLIIDEHGGRKWGKKTAHVGTQAGQHRQDRQRGGLSLEPVGLRGGVLSACGRSPTRPPITSRAADPTAPSAPSSR